MHGEQMCPRRCKHVVFFADTSLCTLLYTLNINFVLFIHHPTHRSRVCETLCVGGHRVYYTIIIYSDATDVRLCEWHRVVVVD